nr:unnamed protein product [Callosobruchus analis]
MKTYVKTSQVIMYSDQCGGQNRNIKLALICNHIIQENHNYNSQSHYQLENPYTILFKETLISDFAEFEIIDLKKRGKVEII